MAGKTNPTIEVQVREHVGSRFAGRLRKAGRIPAVVYGHKQDPVHVSVNLEELIEILRSSAHVIDVTVEGKAEPCLVKEMQWDHLGSDVIHVDLERVDLTEKITVDVDVELYGEAIGLKESGAFMDNPVSQLSVECMVTDIPESIRIDVSELGVGDSITVSDVDLGDKVSINQSPDTLVAVVHLAAVGVSEEAEGEEVAEGDAEPEKIGGNKEEDEE